MGIIGHSRDFLLAKDQRLTDETAVITAVNNSVNWILDQGYKNVLVEVNNECDVKLMTMISSNQTVFTN